MIATASVNGPAALCALSEAGVPDAVSSIPPLYKSLRYPLDEMMASTPGTTDNTSSALPPTRKRSRWWLLLLAPPYLGLCFPALYSRATPALLGFPFFYWYQFAWVITTSCLLWVYYRKHRQTE
jgi:hypothetical protein